MKYVIMFTSTPELDAAVPPERAQEVYGRIYQWFGEHAEKIDDSGAELQPVTTATTVTHGAGGPVVVDGPFSEAKEVIGGFSVVDVARPRRRDRARQDLADARAARRRGRDPSDGRRLQPVRAVSAPDAAAPATPDRRRAGPRHPICSSPASCARSPARIVGALTASLGSLDIAEEAVAEAVEEALREWRVRGVPPNPGGMAHAGGAAQRARPAAARDALPRQARAARRARSSSTARGGRATPTSGCRCCSDAVTPRSRRMRSSP